MEEAPPTIRAATTADFYSWDSWQLLMVSAIQGTLSTESQAHVDAVVADVPGSAPSSCDEVHPVQPSAVDGMTADEKDTQGDNVKIVDVTGIEGGDLVDKTTSTKKLERCNYVFIEVFVNLGLITKVLHLP